MFLVSILAVLFSSYLLTSCIMKQEQKNHLGIIYLLLISFAQIILSCEVLSLFNAINSINFIFANIIILVLSLIIWFRKKKPFYVLSTRSTFKKLIEVLKKDKTLFSISILFIIFLMLQFYLSIFSPCNFGDALSYYFPRCTTWIQQGNLNHFTTLDARELIMPINMDLLYLWKILFTNNINAVGIFSYLCFILAITSLFNFVREIGFSIRTSLWTIFIFSAFALVGLEIYSPISDLFVGALIFTSIYLFLLACKKKTRKSLYFSSLALALAMGTKTTALIVLPIILALFVVISLIYAKEQTKRRLLKLSVFLIFNFLIFSSYNYILNFIDFNNFLSSKGQILLHSFDGGIKGFLCSLIKYSFMFFDISGMPDFVGYNDLINKLQSFVLSLIGENLDSYTSNYFLKYFVFTSKVTLISSLLGLFGIIAFIPSFLLSIKRFLQNKASNKRKVLFSLAVSFIIFLCLLSMTVVYMGYNARFILTFVVIVSPILVYCYVRKFKILKNIFVFFAFIYLFCIPAEIVLENITRDNTKTEEVQIYEFLAKQSSSKIALMIDQGSIPLYEIEKIKLKGVVLEKLLPEIIEKYDLSKYEYIITNRYDLTSTVVVGSYDGAISNCSYWDSEAKSLENYDSSKTVMVLCKIPHKYLYSQGFEEDNIYLKNYIIWKKI